MPINTYVATSLFVKKKFISIANLQSTLPFKRHLKDLCLVLHSVFEHRFPSLRQTSFCALVRVYLKMDATKIMGVNARVCHFFWFLWNKNAGPTSVLFLLILAFLQTSLCFAPSTSVDNVRTAICPSSAPSLHAARGSQESSGRSKDAFCSH